MKWITSDLHFNHSGILKYQANRRFSNVEEMNEGIISEWNSKVQKDDTIYHIGDFAFAGCNDIDTIAHRLNGNKVFIIGNHDDEWLLAKHGKTSSYLEIDCEGVMACLFHFPISHCNKQSLGSYHFYGHTHGRFENHGRSLDVGFDAHGKILSLKEAVERVKNKPIIPPLYLTK
jgi:calcineurin-like phosphoesterase family protein